ncbi:signal peptidase II [Clostridium algidicarnis]|uniref:signal peptidase II n=1 Tax=Clostridium algidicarnis TaxID=37659 RepID=UPI001C0B40AA|nr:signal peptidase II [Clostridium algidicarnis]MBU3208506.1 signal peptidase II [Clostridium algidicarnis]
MSEFFNVTLDKDVVLDDSVISNKAGWTSEKIQKEIINKRITKFEELSDVDVINKKNKQLVAYSEDTQKFTTIDGVEAGEITGAGMKQISKMGVIGTSVEPKIVNIPVNTLDFKVPRVNVLKYDLGTQNIIVTKNGFTNGESNDFVDDDMMIFDGKAHLKTEHAQDYIVSKDEETFVEHVTTLNLSEFKLIEGFEDFEDGVIQKLKVKAIPFDRMLIPKGDMNLSNVEHIDYFKLTAAGKNIRVVCSVDSGATWKTFKTDKWVDINLNVESVRVYGMTVETFNKINDVFWNELVTSKKIRFAYLFSMDSISDIEELDNLDLQFDGQGKWIQAKEDTYDVIYESNSLLQVYIKFSGDIKINY